MSEPEFDEGVRVTDRRRIDPETYEVREQATAPASSEEEVLEQDLTAADA
ncbi:MAG: hypothetical protein RL347_2206, partial [Actinomycetota bacterium]